MKRILDHSPELKTAINAFHRARTKAALDQAWVQNKAGVTVAEERHRMVREYIARADVLDPKHWMEVSTLQRIGFTVPPRGLQKVVREICGR